MLLVVYEPTTQNFHIDLIQRHKFNAKHIIF